MRWILTKNAFWLACGEGVSRSAKLILLVYAARVLGPAGYGEFSFAFAFVSFFVLFSDLGLSQVLTREFSARAHFEKELSKLFTLKVLLAAGTFIFIGIGSFLVVEEQSIRSIILLLGVYIVAESMLSLPFSFLCARERMHYEAFAKMFGSFLMVSVGFAVLFFAPSAQSLAISYLGASLISVFLSFLLFHLNILPFRWEIDIKIWKYVVGVAWPLAFMVAFITLFPQIASLVLGYLGKLEEVGWYNAAYRIAHFAAIPSFVANQAFYPRLSRAVHESSGRIQKLWNYRIGAVFFLAVPFAVAGVFFASPIITFFYGPDFYPAIFAFQLLAVAMSLFMVVHACMQILTVYNQGKKNFFISAWGLFVGVLLSIACILLFGLPGASLGVLFTIAYVLLLAFFYAKKHTSIHLLHAEALSFLSAAIGGSVLLYGAGVLLEKIGAHIFVTLGISFLLYMLGFMCFKYGGDKVLRKRLYAKT